MSDAPTPPPAGAHPAAALTDDAVDQLIGRLLQIGVLIAALVVLCGGVLLLAQHGGARVSYAVFNGEPAQLRSLAGIVRGAFALDSRSLVQLGLVLLIATPVARVAFTLVAFIIQRDRVYVAVTVVVLALLVYGLVFGTA
jgi:uncharacterized membrane protein